MAVMARHGCDPGTVRLPPPQRGAAAAGVHCGHRATGAAGHGPAAARRPAALADAAHGATTLKAAWRGAARELGHN